MTSQPISQRNKSSKFTLTKKEFYENINKKGVSIKNNIGSIFPSEFSQYKKTTIKKNNKIQNSNHFNLTKNNNTIDKSKNNNINTDFLKLFRQFDLFKKNKTSNKTAIEISLQEKRIKSIFASSVSNSKSKGKNNQKQNFKSKPQKYYSKKQNLKITFNSNYDTLNNNEKNNTINNINSIQKSIILTNHNKNTKLNDYLQKNHKPKKNFKNFNPFHIRFAKPINAINKNKIKQSNITTYQINFSKLIPNQIHSLQNNFNKTQEIYNNNNSKKKTKEKDDKKSNKESYNNSINQKNENIKINNNNCNDYININNNCSVNQNKQINRDKIIIKENIDKYIENEIESLKNNQNINNIDIFDERENYVNYDDDEESDNSGVLAYDEVRDIIIYYDMGDLNKKQNYLFVKDDYKNYINNKKTIYLDFFIKSNMNQENNRVLKINENKKQTPPTNDTNKTKKNFININ